MCIFKKGQSPYMKKNIQAVHDKVGHMAEGAQSWGDRASILNSVYREVTNSGKRLVKMKRQP